MNKGKALRIGGFTLAVGLTASLVGFAAHGTGAYFTDTQPGEIDASTGTIHLTINDPSQGKLQFADLMPGNYQTVPLTYTATTTDPNGEDVWLVFPTTGGANGSNPSEAFTGLPSDPGAGPLGRYGHFAVSAPAGSFTSYNLTTNPNSASDPGPTCNTDGDGHGGSNAQPTSPSDTQVAFCSPIKPILLSSGLKNGVGNTAQMTFGFTPLLRDQSQYASLNKIVSYELVATQHGILPNNPFNPNPTQH